MDSKSGIKRGGNIHEHSEKENFALWDAFRNGVVFILSCSRRAAGEGIFKYNYHQCKWKNILSPGHNTSYGYDGIFRIQVIGDAVAVF